MVNTWYVIFPSVLRHILGSLRTYINLLENGGRRKISREYSSGAKRPNPPILINDVRRRTARAALDRLEFSSNLP